MPDVIEIVGAVIAGLLGRELWEWGRRKFFPKSPEIEFRGWLLNYNRAAQTLLVKVQAVVPSSPSHIAYAGCNVEIGGAVHVTELERPKEGMLLESNVLLFNFARRKPGVQFDPDAPPETGKVMLEFKVGESTVKDEHETRLAVS